MNSGSGKPLAAIPELVAKADAQYEAGDFEGAEDLYCRILDIYSAGEILHGRYHPAFILFKLGRALEAQESANDAVEVYTASVNARPSDPAYAELGYLTFLQLGRLMMSANRLVDALKCFDRAITIFPRASAYVQRGAALQELGLFDEAEAAFSEAISKEPDNFVARIGKCTACLPVAYSSEQEITDARARYSECLSHIAAHYDAATAEEKATAAAGVGVLQPFYLAYQGYNDRDLQQTYGELICDLMAARLPQFSQLRRPRQRGRTEKIRVGFVSRFLFSTHSVWKLPLRGWVDGLDRDVFDVFAYKTSSHSPDEPPSETPSLARYLTGPLSTEEWCQEIDSDALDVLIYPEFGMDPDSLPLGALRLAPLQMNAMGHPVTSGMPTIDVYLSSELMEPDDGQEHYTEELVRLPNLGFTYAPTDVTPEPVSRRQLGIADDEAFIWCCQSLYKLLPQHDDVFPRIAQKLGRCKIVFIEDHRSEATNTEIFKARLSDAFKQFDLSMEEHCVFESYMDVERFSGICANADVFLDSLAWSGNNTALEAIAQNLPIVTMPGGLMRARHAQAHLRMMGVTDTIAATKAEYVDLAVRLIKQPDWRAAISKRYAVNKHKLYHDPAPTRELERVIVTFLERGEVNEADA